ncbi:unnamed protein product [Caenorhabditis angaria]|uniref:DUF1279 domain-containing protein n=1 Tax=Caenorhabditis angaria TaxID=860376 RepID=A0A9P1IJM6_9PELO|nr:unnamed protein product [Caenorhabditis angaria]
MLCRSIIRMSIIRKESLNLINQQRMIQTTRKTWDENKKSWFRLTMSDEQKKAKTKKIEEMSQEQAPKSLFAKVKYYFKRYWYIAVPAHMASSTGWFVGAYLIVQSGVDIIALLEYLHMPDAIIEKVKSTPETAGVIVLALILYKIATPLRYATTLFLIQSSFWILRRMGKLKTLNEVEYKVRAEYELNKSMYGRRWYRYRNHGVRSVSRKNSAHANTSSSSQIIRLQKEHEKLNIKIYYGSIYS